MPVIYTGALPGACAITLYVNVYEGRLARRPTNTGMVYITGGSFIEAGHFFCLVQWMLCDARVSGSALRWHATDRRGYVRAASLKQCIAWFWAEEGGVVVVEK